MTDSDQSTSPPPNGGDLMDRVADLLRAIEDEPVPATIIELARLLQAALDERRHPDAE